MHSPLCVPFFFSFIYSLLQHSWAPCIRFVGFKDGTMQSWLPHKEGTLIQWNNSFLGVHISTPGRSEHRKRLNLAEGLVTLYRGERKGKSVLGWGRGMQSAGTAKSQRSEPKYITGGFSFQFKTPQTQDKKLNSMLDHGTQPKARTLGPFHPGSVERKGHSCRVEGNSFFF